MVVPLESLVISGVKVEHHVVILPVGNASVTVVVVSGLGIDVRIILVGDGLAVLVVELSCDCKVRNDFPVYGRICYHISAGSLVGLQVGDCERMAVVICAVAPVVTCLLVIHREDRISPVCKSSVVVPAVVADVGAGLHGQVVEHLVLHAEISAVLVIAVLDVHTVVEIIVETRGEACPVCRTLYLHGSVVGNRSLSEHEVIPAGVGGPGGLEFLDGRIVDTVGIGRSDILLHLTGIAP